jgi:hypothetical protein
MAFRHYEWTRFTCFTPNDGFWVSIGNVLYRTGPWVVQHGYSAEYRNYFNPRTRLLRFERPWFSSDAEIVKCVSRRTGLTCRHWRGHGWWIGRYRGYHIF